LRLSIAVQSHTIIEHSIAKAGEYTKHTFELPTVALGIECKSKFGQSDFIINYYIANVAVS